MLDFLLTGLISFAIIVTIKCMPRFGGAFLLCKMNTTKNGQVYHEYLRKQYEWDERLDREMKVKKWMEQNQFGKVKSSGSLR